MAEIKTYTLLGFKVLVDELDYLVNVRVEENKKDISTARSFGDLSENSEYDEAKSEQGKIHTRIAELRDIIANAEVTVTAPSFAELRAEIEEITTVAIPECEKAITAALAAGNAEAHEAAKAKLAKLNSRVFCGREIVAHAVIIDESQIDESVVSVGSIVKVFIVERNREAEYRIVGSYAADPVSGKISDVSPIGSKLLGARAGDEVVVEGVRTQHIRVLEVSRAKDN